MFTKSDRVKILALDEYEALVRRLENAATERDALRAALKRVRNLANNGNLSAEAACLEIGIVAHDALDEGGA